MAAPAQRTQETRATTEMDQIVTAWLDEIADFAAAYARLESFIELRGIALPDVTA